MIRIFRLFACIFAVAALFFVFAQQHAIKAQDQEAPAYRVSVNRVYDYVVVLDRDGKFVKNLTAKDFTVKVNGELVRAESADEVHNITRSSAEWTRFGSVDIAAREIEAGKTNIAPEHYVLLFDIFNSGPASIRGAKKTAYALLDQLLPIDKVSVYEYNGTLRLLTPERVPGPEEARELIKSISELSRNPFYRPNAGEMRELVDRAPSHVYRAKVELYRGFLRAMQSLADGLAHQTIAKRVILFTEGPNIFATTQELDFDDVFKEKASKGSSPEGKNASSPRVSSHASSDIGMLNEIRAAVGNLQNFMAGADVVFYTVRRGRLQPEWILAVDQDIAYNEQLSERPSTILGMFNDMHTQRLNNARTFAETTGGRFYGAGFSDERLVNEILEETGNYYHLFFTVPEKIERDGFNKVEITTKNPEYRVKHKRGFFGPETRQYLLARRATLQAEESLQKEAVAELSTTCTTYPFPHGGGADVLVHFEIDPEAVDVTKDGTAAFELGLETEDSQGQVLYSGVRTVRSRAARIGNAPISFFTDLPFASAGGALTVSVRDLGAGKQFWTRRTINVRSSGESLYTLSRPLLLQVDEMAPTVVVANADGSDEAMDNLTAGLIGRPVSGGTVGQGERVEVVLFIGRVHGMFDPERDRFAVDFYLERDGAENAEVTLVAKDAAVDVLRGGVVLRYRAMLPIGYAPFEKGRLIIDIFDPKANDGVGARLPFVIGGFDAERALELSADDTAIVKM